MKKYTRMVYVPGSLEHLQQALQILARYTGDWARCIPFARGIANLPPAEAAFCSARWCAENAPPPEALFCSARDRFFFKIHQTNYEI
jgi:hypothetical protein